MKKKCWVKYEWVTIPNQTVDLNSKFLLDLSCYAAKKELHHATSVSTCYLAAKKISLL